jgi:cytochrome c55X
MLTRNSLLQTLSFFILLLFSLALQANQAGDRRQELQYLIKHDCGSCHGMTLKGGLGPALLVESLRNKSDELLFVTISEGRQGTPMPAWKSLLSKDDITLIIEILRSGSIP